MVSEPKKPATVDKIVDFFENDFADIRCQAQWDFSGKQIYLGDRKVNKICLALDPAKSVINQAVNRGCELLITHHPLFFRPSQGVNVNKPCDSILIEAVKKDLTVISYHTNLDTAPDGLNTYLLRLFSAQETALLGKDGEVAHSRLTVYVPESHETVLIDSMERAGAGQIRNYSRCAFSTKGIGTFTPQDNANPFIGKKGEAAYVNETCIDIIVPDDKVNSVLTALKEVHPYEEPAYFISPTFSPHPFSTGRIGRLSEPVSFEMFIDRIKKVLNLNYVSTNIPEYNKPVETFAVVAGSGACEWKKCLLQGVDLLVTGDLKHHDAVDAREAGVCIIDAGHFTTEKIYFRYLAEVLESRFDVKCIEANEVPGINII